MSDSVVLSVDITVPNAFAKISMFLSEYLSELLLLTTPFFARGAIKVDYIFHEDNVVFGPALVKAVDMEKKNALNFRCIIDENEFNELSNMENGDFKNIIDAYYYLDGEYYCFDYLYRFLGFADNKVLSGDNANIFINALGRIQKRIRDELNNSMNGEDVKKKYHCMEQYFNRTLTRVLDYSDYDEYVWLKKAREDRRNKK